MKIKVNEYYPSSSITSNTGTTITDIPEGESFEEVLVLNQTALKAMAIDAMVAESSTGSVDPDAVNAAAIMKFRSTLASHIVAPIPEEDVSLGTPQKAGTATTQTAPSTDDTQIVTANTDTLPTNTITEATIDTTIYNSGNLECSEELNTYFAEASSQYGIDAKLLKAVAFCESSFNPNCTSYAGAMGIMQMMPKTAEYCGVTDPYDPRQSILGGAQYLSLMLDRYDGDITLALAAYNAGPGNVDKSGGIPFKSTENYVKKVLGYYNS